MEVVTRADIVRGFRPIVDRIELLDRNWSLLVDEQGCTSLHELYLRSLTLVQISVSLPAVIDSVSAVWGNRWQEHVVFFSLQIGSTHGHFGLTRDAVLCHGNVAALASLPLRTTASSGLQVLRSLQQIRARQHYKLSLLQRLVFFSRWCVNFLLIWLSCSDLVQKLLCLWKLIIESESFSRVLMLQRRRLIAIFALSTWSFIVDDVFELSSKAWLLCSLRLLSDYRRWMLFVSEVAPLYHGLLNGRRMVFQHFAGFVHCALA